MHKGWRGQLEGEGFFYGRGGGRWRRRMGYT